MRSRPATTDGMLDLDIDPKLAWALKNRDRFPVDVNTRRARDAAARAGPRRARRRRASSRRAGTRRLRLDDVARLTAGLKRARPFLIAADHRPVGLTDRADLRQRLAAPPQQLSLFG